MLSVYSNSIMPSFGISAVKNKTTGTQAVSNAQYVSSPSFRGGASANIDFRTSLSTKEEKEEGSI